MTQDNSQSKQRVLSEKLVDILHDKTHYSTESVNNAVEDIMKLIKGLVPEERNIDGFSARRIQQWDNGFNECRQQLLDKLEG